jgi:hypothetical protein
MGCIACIGYEASLIGLHRMQQQNKTRNRDKKSGRTTRMIVLLATIQTKESCRACFRLVWQPHSKNMRGPYKTCTSAKLGGTQPADKALQSMYLLITDLEREFATNHQLNIGNPHRSQHASYGCHEGGSYPPWQQIHTLFKSTDVTIICHIYVAHNITNFILKFCMLVCYIIDYYGHIFK